MAVPNQEPFAAEVAGAKDEQGHPTTAGDSQPYADIDRFGKTIIANRTMPIQVPNNRISDDVWGVNNTAGGTNKPDAPEINVTSK